MKLVKLVSGFVFSFGFDMRTRTPNPKIVCWCDPETGEWEASTKNQAGCISFSRGVDPEFFQEMGPARFIAYQPGRLIEWNLCGAPYVWSMSEQWVTPAAAAAA